MCPNRDSARALLGIPSEKSSTFYNPRIQLAVTLNIQTKGTLPTMLTYAAYGSDAVPVLLSFFVFFCINSYLETGP